MNTTTAHVDDLPSCDDLALRPCIVLLCVVVVLGLAVRLANLGSASLWLDEAWLALSVNDSQFHNIIFRGPVDLPNSTPYLFSLASHFLVKLFGNNETTLRLMPAIFSSASPALIFLLARQLRFTRTAALLAAVALAFNPQSIYFASEFKQYAGDAMWLILLFSATQWYLARRTTSRAIIVGAAGVIGLGFSHTAIFAELSAAVVLLGTLWSERKSGPGVDRGRFDRAGVALILGLWFVGFVATDLLVLRHQRSPQLISNWGDHFAPTRSINDALTFCLSQWIGFFHSTFPVAGWVVLALYGFGIFTAFRVNWIGTLGYLTVPWLIAWALSIAQIYPFGPIRVDLYLAPVLILPVGLGGSAVLSIAGAALSNPAAKRMKIGAITAVGLVMFFMAAANELYTPKSREELRPLMPFYLAHVKPADVTLLIDPLTQYAFEYYSRQSPHPFEIYQGPLEGAAVVAFIEQFAKPGQRVWLPNTHHYLHAVEPVYHAIAQRWPDAQMMTSNGAELTLIVGK